MFCFKWQRKERDSAQVLKVGLYQHILFDDMKTSYYKLAFSSFISLLPCILAQVNQCGKNVIPVWFWKIEQNIILQTDRNFALRRHNISRIGPEVIVWMFMTTKSWNVYRFLNIAFRFYWVMASAPTKT